MAKNSIDESKINLRLSDLTSESNRMLLPIKGFENQPLVSLEESVKPLISIVPEIESMVWIVKQNCQNPQDHLTADETGSIMLYTLEWDPSHLSFYFLLNKTLRSQTRQELRPWFLYLRLVMHALAKLPSLSCRTIYRGVRINMSEEYVKDRTITWWAFSSCTSTIGVIENFLGNKGPRTIINIECDSAKDISRHSFYQSENEILLYPARHFQVISSLDAGNQLYIIHVKETQPLFSLIHIPQISSTIISTIPVPSINNSNQNQALKYLIKKCQHQPKVDLGHENLTDTDMKIVANEGIIDAQCIELRLHKNKITSPGVSIIAKALNENTRLKILWLSYNNIGDEGVYFLAEILSFHNHSLCQLDLDSTGITDKGAKYLAEMLKTNSMLRQLDLHKNNIGNRGIELLAKTLAYHNCTLQWITLNENKLVNDECVDALVEMLKLNCSLSCLFISNCSLSQQGKQRLQEITQRKIDFCLFV